ncbi:Hsp20/alpha crystallin family protein [Breznakiella homolactica]|uniref:Hsp20/alpha crystallin family protein n=1 Tax=Breznakiella homolactica TaxID=2798577 RepID=A0A7T8BB50_9SPIR|nr:Hsp20/alpha crystallin family protein [Breznakiella homolactica]QQO09665.1 Hsp20/alpha crystallin family protein [Breznakiella homolactica]
MKSVTLYRPVSIDKALNDFDRYMESFFGDSPLTPAMRSGNFVPAADIRENDEGYTIDVELPGYDEKSVEVHADGRTLTIESKKAEETEKKEDNFVLRERRSSSFSRSFRLPEDADRESISARFKNGILSLEIKKQAEAKKRLIEIESK